MTRAGIAPNQILTSIRQKDPDTFIAATDICSERKAMKIRDLRGRSPTEALLDELSSLSTEWRFDVKKNINNHVQCLFFAHQKQVELLLANPDILLMDCTYRTNRYKLPLLHILGCTNLQTFFSAGFYFLRNETQQDYYWAVSTFFRKTGVPPPLVFISDHEDALKSAISELLPTVPQLLCVWHINKNVQTKAQYTWRDADGVTKEEKEKIAEKRAQFMSRWYQVSHMSVSLALYINLVR
jgi:MULE transposase-like protein